MPDDAPDPRSHRERQADRWLERAVVVLGLLAVAAGGAAAAYAVQAARLLARG